MNNPHITAFKFPNELEFLYKCFYLSKDTDLKRQAISKVRSYLTKSPIPHSIEITALLMEAMLEDETQTGVKLFKYEERKTFLTSSNNPTATDLNIRLQYSMIMVKFVNGLLDPFQQSMFNISLHKLAVELKLPNYFVECRHICTHERLPSLQMLRMITQRAYQWLRVEYWENILNKYKSLDLLEVNETRWNMSLMNVKRTHDLKTLQQKEQNGDIFSKYSLKEVENLLKSIRKDRKREIQEKVKLQSVVDDTNKLKHLIDTKNASNIIQIMIFRNVLLLQTEKNHDVNEKQLVGMRMIWGTILQNLDVTFVTKLWIELFKLSTSTTLVNYGTNYVEECIINNKPIKYLKSEAEIRQCENWIKWILENITFIDKSNIGEIVQLLFTQSNASRICVPILNNQYSALLTEVNCQEKIATLEKTIQRFWTNETNFKKRTLEDVELNILDDENTNKRTKTSINLFDSYSSWRPIPFGCPPPI
ncbi:uncharacterized protein C5L36_0B12450 [Pichia kudriavzevii]|uniref:Protein LAS1 n=1 Tax=Pichia kudriavzevii TaxID=4909 RepID=A0A2U9R3V5_PICKU|nr:uncharacterized protein C5L36_0B12450 [Pichia kudriavzevii]AWU76017.1 hypothetical protein C5L36_0B12450 [Pichia kudriavzevii]